MTLPVTSLADFIARALPLAEQREFFVFPLKGKQPLTKHGFKDATNDPDQIRAWGQLFPRANVGVRTGRFIVIDIDDLRQVSQLNLPPTFTVKTGRGLHCYFLAPPGAVIGNSASTLAKGVDVRGEVGYVVGPGSIHPEPNTL